MLRVLGECGRGRRMCDKGNLRGIGEGGGRVDVWEGGIFW